MSLQTWVETIVTQQAAGSLLNTFTTAKSVINPQALYTLPPGFWVPGKCIEVDVDGAISNIVTTPGTVTFQVMMGTIVAFTTGPIQLNATAHTTLPFTFNARLTCDTVGSTTTAKLRGQARVGGVMFTLTAAQVDAVNTSGLFMGPTTAPAVGTGFDSTISNILDFWTGFSISGAGNGVQVHQYTVKSLN